MSRDLMLDLERITREQALERARRSRSYRHSRQAGYPCRVVAVTPCGELEPDLEVVGESGNYTDAVALGCATVYARSRFDSVAALVLIAEGNAAPNADTRPSEHSERVGVALAVAVTLEAHPRFRSCVVNADTLEVVNGGDDPTSGGGLLVEVLEKAALAAEPLRATRRSLGIDAEG